MKVEKRDGTIQKFNFNKIKNVIYKVFANREVKSPVPPDILDVLKTKFDNIINSHSENYTMPIEDIQDIIRDTLMKKHKKAAEAFVKYRAKREEIREKKSWYTKEITKKIKGVDVENQNANLDE